MSQPPRRITRKGQPTRRHTLLFEHLEARYVLSVEPSIGAFVDSEQVFNDFFAQALAVGDFNADGSDDLFVGTNGELARVLLSDGNGQFVDTGQRLDSGPSEAAVVDDLDNDGDLDVVVVERRGLVVWANNGNGHFTSAGRYSTDVDLGSATLGDFDNDGDVDLTVVGASHTIWLNDGSAQFTAQVPFLIGGFYEDVDAGDIDGDGDLDLMVVPGSGTVTFWLNDGAANFSASSATISGGRIGGTLADFDGDGDLDAAVMARNNPVLWVNDGTGVFINVPSAFANGREIEAIDLEGDGDMDLIVGVDRGSTSVSNKNFLLVNRGDGTFERPSADFGLGSVTAMAVGDFDGDRDEDIAVADNNDERLTVYLNSDTDLVVQISPTTNSVPAGSSELIFYDLTVVNKGPRDVPAATLMDAFADVLSDVSITSIVLAGDATNAIGVGDVAGNVIDTVSLPTGASITYAIEAMLNVPSGTQLVESHVASISTIGGVLESSLANNRARGVNSLLPLTRLSSAVFVDTGQRIPTRGEAVALGDLDGDGDVDAFVATDTSDDSKRNKVLLNAGDGTFEVASEFGLLELDSITLADIDSDGDLDAVGTRSNDSAQIWLNDGHANFDLQDTTVFNRATYVGFGDLDNDGDMDAFVTRANDIRGVGNLIFWNDGFGGFVDSGQLLGTSDSYHVDLKDIDGDGDLDAVVANRYRDPENRVWVNDGLGNFTDSGVALGNGATRTVVAADFTGDGVIDILAGNRGSASVLWVANSGDYMARPLPSDPSNDYGMEVADLDGDGDLDVLLAGSDRVFLNDGQGNLTNTDGQTFNTGVFGAALADLDGDGDIDGYFVGAEDNQDQIWLNADVDLKLRFAQSPVGATIEPGQTLDYEFVVENTGPNPVSDIPLAIRMPMPLATATIDQVTASDGAVSSLNPNPGAVGALVEDTVSLEVGAQISYNLRVTLSSETDDYQSPNSTATLSIVAGTGHLLDANSLDNVLVDSNLVSLTTAKGSGVLIDTGQELGNVASYDVALGDVDGDGDLDAVVANSDSAPANRVWINDGSGNFADSGQVLGDFGSTSLSLGDIDGDGDLDAFIANGAFGDRVPTLFLNDGDGDFTVADRGLLTRGTGEVALVDLDGDGDLDALIENSAYRNDGFGFFSPMTTAVDAYSSFGDIDGDGDLDAIRGNDVRLNNGAFDFESGLNLNSGVSPTRSHFADVDGDADLDAILLVGGAEDVVLLNDGTGAFADTGLRIDNEFSNEVEIGDLDGDGDLDLLTFNYERFGKQRPELFLNDGAGNFTSNGQLLDFFNSVDGAVGDLDGDGDLDAFVVSSEGPNRVWINPSVDLLADLGVEKSAREVEVRQGDELTYTVTITNHGPGTVNGATVRDSLPGELTTAELVSVETTGSGVSTAATGPLAGELVDLFDLPVGATITYEISGTVAVPGAPRIANQFWLSNVVEVTPPADVIDPFIANNRAVDADVVTLLATGGSGLFEDSGQSFTSAEARDVKLGDLDGDGDLDAIAVYEDAPDEVLLNDGNGGYEFHAFVTFNADEINENRTLAAVLGDVDNDGDLDVYIVNDVRADRLWLNDGDASFVDSGVPYGFDDSNPEDLTFVDINGDGHLDLINGSEVFLNNANAVFVDNDTFLGSRSNRLAFGDLDGDGDLDVLGKYYHLRNDGTGSFERVGERFSDNSSPWTLGDLDGDGDLDAFRGRFYSQEVWINDAGTFTLSSTLPGAPGAEQVALADVDGDGDLDALVDERDSNVHVWLNQGDATFIDTGLRLGSSSISRFALGDLNDDGSVDAFVVGANGASSTWFNQTSKELVDLSVDIADNKVTATSGSTVVYSITARNAGATTVTDAVLQTEFSSAIAGARITQIATAAGGEADATIGPLNGPFDDTLDLPPGASVTYTLEVEMLPSGAAANIASYAFTLSASINHTPSNDATPGDNETYDVNIVRPGAQGGTGRFAEADYEALSDFPEDISLADIDSDGDLDALVVYSNGGGDVLTNNGHGNFALAQHLQENPFYTDERTGALADVDGDGDVDAFVRTIWFKNNGSGRFTNSGLELPASAIFGDLNGDGIIDAIAEDRVRINDGTGVFTAIGPSLGSRSIIPKLGDLDGDGDLDAFYGGGNPGQVVWLNNGDGVFTATSTALEVTSNRGFDVGDLDEDGDLDAWVVLEDFNRVYLNDGNASFIAQPQEIPRTNYNNKVALADIDGDGDLDALTTVHDVAGPQSVFRNNGDATFTEIASISSLESLGNIAVGDLDDDGDVDAVFGGYRRFLVQLNGDVDLAVDLVSPTEQVAPAQLVPYTLTVTNNGPIDVAQATVNLSISGGLQSLVLQGVQLSSGATSGGPSITLNETAVYSGVVTDTITLPVGGTILYTFEAIVGANNLPNALAEARISAHASVSPPMGIFDATVGNNTSRQDDLLVTGSSLPTGIFADSGQELGDTDDRDVALADIDGDGDLDAVTAAAAGVNLWINTAGVFSIQQTLGVQDSLSIGLGDLDSDGDLDLVVGTDRQGNRVWLNDGTGRFIDTNQSIDDEPTTDVALVDFDGDGDLDVLAANFGRGSRLLLNDGTGYFFLTEGPREYSQQRVEPGDLDGDGDLDIVSSFTNGDIDGSVKVRLNNADGTFSDAVNLNDFAGATDLAIGDLDGDGELDAFFAMGVISSGSQLGRPNRVLLNDGSGGLVDSGQALGFSDSSAVSLADIDADGDLDAYVVNEGQADQVWINNGAGQFSRFGPGLGSDAGQAVALGDVDGDGLLDAFVANANGPNRIWNGLDIREFPDLRISTSSGQVTATRGDLLVYTIEVENQGLRPVEGATVLADFDAALGDLRLDSIAGAGGARSSRAPGPLTNQLSDTVYLPVGAKIQYQVSATISVDTVNSVPGGLIFQTARVELPSQFSTDLTPADNRDADHVLVELQAGPGTAQFALAETPSPGGSVIDVQFGDLDGDGDLDAFVLKGLGSTGSDFNANRVWFNDGKGTFTDSGQALGTDRSTHVALGDLDGDGDLDAFEGTSGANRVWINDGSGVFTESQQTIGFRTTLSLALGDLDNDGDLDAFEATTSQDQVWMNDGFGRFTSVQMTNASVSSSEVKLGDIDADGDLDAVISALGRSTIVYLNDSRGNFSLSGSITTDALRGPLDIGDIDGDGDLDIVQQVELTIPDGDRNFETVYRVQVSRNDGQGGFTSSIGTYNLPFGGEYALSDFDGDGDLDLAIAGTAFGSANSSRIWLNDGAGDFDPAPSSMRRPLDAFSMAVGDVDGDGDADVLYANNEGATQLWLSIHEADLAVDVTSNVTSVGIGDQVQYAIRVTNEGQTPVLNARLSASLASQFVDATVVGVEVAGQATSDQSIGPITSSLDALVDLAPGASISYLVAATIAENSTTTVSDAVVQLFASINTRTAESDIVSSNNQSAVSQLVLLSRDSGHGAYVNSAQQLGTGIATDVAVGDIDRDGDLDVVLGYRLAPDELWINDGRGNFTVSSLTLGNSDTFAIALGDADSDGDLDIVVAHRNAGLQFWRQNFDGTFSLRQNFGAQLDYRDLAMADLNGDGRLDLFVAAYGTSHVWLGGVDRLFQSGGNIPHSDDSSAVALGDVDGDGDIDALLANARGQANTVWLNNGHAEFADSGQRLGNHDSTDAAFADLDGDDDLDAYVTNRDAGNGVWLNDGTGVFISTPHPTGDRRSVGVALGDVDGDGDLDAVVANEGSQSNQIWLNDGAARLSDAGLNFGMQSTNALVLGDADGDGDLDMVAANSFGDGNQFWRNQLTVDTPSADFNGDYVVDLADYIVWRKNLGRIVDMAGTQGDADANGYVDRNDYQVWKSTFGSIIAAPSQRMVLERAVEPSLGSTDQPDSAEFSSQPAVGSLSVVVLPTRKSNARATAPAVRYRESVHNASGADSRSWTNQLLLESQTRVAGRRAGRSREVAFYREEREERAPETVAEPSASCISKDQVFSEVGRQLRRRFTWR